MHTNYNLARWRKAKCRQLRHLENTKNEASPTLVDASSQLQCQHHVTVGIGLVFRVSQGVYIVQ